MLLASRDNASKSAEIDIIYVACIDRLALGRINRLIYDRFIYSKNYSNRPSLLSPSKKECNVHTWQCTKYNLDTLSLVRDVLKLLHI